MTSLAQLLPTDADLRARLRERLDAWLDALVAHDILVARAVRGVQLEAVDLFDEHVTRPLLRAVAGRLATARPPRSFDLFAEALPDVALLRGEVVQIAGAGALAVQRLVQDRMAAIARQEVVWHRESMPKLTGFGAGVFESRLGAAAEAAAEQAARAGLWLGDTTEDHFRRMLAGPTGDKARAWVTSAHQHGLSIDETVRGLVGTRTQTGILESGRTAARALTRTAMTHAGNSGRAESMRALAVQYWRFRATLDLRTSEVCAGLDGEVYRVGEGPTPPLHVNCRSVAVPITDPRAPQIGTRAALGGRVPADTTFGQWLEAQPKSRQDLWFGRTKAAAWRSGQLTIKDLVGRDLEPLTLAELRALDRL